MIKALAILHADKMYMPGETLKLLKKEEERLITQGLAVACCLEDKKDNNKKNDVDEVGQKSVNEKDDFAKEEI